MDIGKTKKPKSMHTFKSSLTKDQLIHVLHPLCDDIPWMKEWINHIKTCRLPDNHFEISGLARKITYRLIEEHPELFSPENSKILLLKELMIHCFMNIKVPKLRKEATSKIIEEAFQKAIRSNNLSSKRSK